MAVINHGRQYATEFDDIRDDHRIRYIEASKFIDSEDIVLDCGCGIGYGSQHMGIRAFKVYGFDVDPKAIKYAQEHFARENVEYQQLDLNTGTFPEIDADRVVAFEVIEHVENPEFFLRQLADMAHMIICSVPNELVTPYNRDAVPQHFRHYTPDQFAELLDSSGWVVMGRYSQQDKTGEGAEIKDHVKGRTLVYTALSKFKSRFE